MKLVAQVLNTPILQMSSTYSCRVCSSSRAILSSLISACRLCTVGSSLWATVLPSTTTLGGAGRTGGGVLGCLSGFAGDDRTCSELCNELGGMALHRPLNFLGFMLKYLLIKLKCKIHSAQYC